MNAVDVQERKATPQLPAPIADQGYRLAGMFRPPTPEFAYRDDGKQPYMLAEGQMYAEAIIQAIADAGAVPGVQTTRREIIDAVLFLYDPADRRRHYIAAAANIDKDALDRMLAKLLDPSLAALNLPGRNKRVTPVALEQLRERVGVFQNLGEPGLRIHVNKM